MPFQQAEQIRFFTFESFPKDLVQGIFTRHGGVSPEPWNSLNHGGSLGDPRENVIENRRRIFQAVGRPVESLYDVWQVHGTEVICAEQPRPLDAAHVKADAIITNHPELTLYMRFADCVPIFLYDPVQQAVGIVHAGWQGTVKKAPLFAVEAMQRQFQTRPADLLAGIGPSIGVDHYEVGSDVIDATHRAFGEKADQLLKRIDGRIHLDLWQANRVTLQEAGVTQIEISGICTACHTDDWYSHRGEKGKTGRFGALLALAPSRGDENG